MTFIVEYIDNHIFIDGVFGKVAERCYFYCNHYNCPFAFKVTLQLVEGKKELWLSSLSSVRCTTTKRMTNLRVR